ncbi:MAG TPA: hypothetical protein VMG32_07060 [Anaeromyxobacteraceae bacterium]|nr:hypothetical protein [Anaeromyxobacteraceae bacterium]
MSTSETLAGWARRLQEESEIPKVFAGPFSQVGLKPSPFPLVIFCPPFRFDRFAIAPRLLVAAGERVVCLEELPEGVRSSELSLSEVHAAEWGTELLSSWLRLEAHSRAGPAAIRVDFNTASREVFHPVLEALRERRYRGLHTDPERELTKFDPLSRVDFKLMTLGRQCLVDGAVVLRFHLQNRVSTPGPLGETVVSVPASLAVLTQKELILIREGDERDTGYYAGVFTFLDLAHLERLEVVPAADRPVVELRAVLAGGALAASVYDREGEPGLRAFAGEVVKVRWPVPAET